MTCAACHVSEGEGTCQACRELAELAELAEDLRLNAEVLAALRDEVLPASPVRWCWPVPWKTAIAAAALIAAALPILHRSAPAPVVTTGRQLKVKLLTPDPDVVIYWLIDEKEDVAK